MGFHGKQILPGTLPVDRIYTTGYAPAAASDLTTVAYVQALNAGLDPKAQARVRAVVNINLASPPANIDSVIMNEGDRVVLGNQSDPIENGVYDYHAAGMTRSADCDGTPVTGVVKTGTFIFVAEGATYAGYGFFVSGTPASPPTINVGTDPIVFATLQIQASYVAGSGLTLTGSSFALGGPLAADTTLDGGGAANMVMTNLTSYEVASVGYRQVLDKGGSIFRVENYAATQKYLDIKANWRINIPMDAGGGAGQVNADYSVNFGANGVVNDQHSFNAAKDTVIDAGASGAFAAGLNHVVGDGVGSHGKNGAAFGVDTINNGEAGLTSGVGAEILYVANQRGGIAHGFSTGTGLKPVGVPYVTASAGAVNISRNTVAQTAGYGALAQDSVILGGYDHHIPADSPGSAIIGGSTIVARPLEPNQVYVPNFNIIESPLPGGILDPILVRDDVTGQIKKIDQSSLAASVGNGSGTTGNFDAADLGGTILMNTDINLDNYEFKWSSTTAGYMLWELTDTVGNQSINANVSPSSFNFTQQDTNSDTQISRINGTASSAMATAFMRVENQTLSKVAEIIINSGSANAILLTDTVNNRGAEYAADYSANYTNRSLVDKEYVDDAIAGATVTLTDGNGTTANGSAIDLGGTLTANVLLTDSTGTVNSFVISLADANSSYLYQVIKAPVFASHAIQVSDSTSGYTSSYSVSSANGIIMNFNDGSSAYVIEMGPSGFRITDNIDGAGIQYLADYSAGYTNRSLVDKEYVDGVVTGAFWALTGTSTLTGDATIAGDSATYGITFDQITSLQVNATTGITMVTTDGGMQLINAAGTGGYTLYHGASGGFSITTNSGAGTFYIGHSGTGQLTIQQSGTSGFQLRNDNTSGDDFYIQNTSDGDLIISNTAAGQLRIENDGSDQLRIINNAGTNGLFVQSNTGAMAFEANGTGGFSILNNTDGITVINNGNSGITISSTAGAMIVDDQRIAPAGLEYNADYSATFSVRSLVDKGYVDSLVGAFWPLTGTAALTGTVNIQGGGNDLNLGTNANKLAQFSTYTDVGTFFTFDDTTDQAYMTMTNSVAGFSSSYGGVSYFMKIDSITGVTLAADTNQLLMNATGGQITLGGTNIFAYAADYSANYTNRSLVDKEYVDGTVSGSVSTASNGLTKVVNDIQLGGALTADTTVDVDANLLSFSGTTAVLPLLDATKGVQIQRTNTFSGQNAVSTLSVNSLGVAMTAFENAIADVSSQVLVGSNSVLLEVDNNASGELVILQMGTGPNGFFIQDVRTTPVGLEYQSDYSANYTNRSLVDKEYVDNAVGGISASNGLTEAANVVKLGGALIENTTIQVDDPFSFSFNTTGFISTSASSIFTSTGGPNTGDNYTGGGYSVAEDGSDNIYYGGVNTYGLWQYNKSTQVGTNLTTNYGGTGPACPNFEIYQMAYNPANSKLYVATYGGGVWIYDTVANSSVIYNNAGGGYTGTALPTDFNYSVTVNSTHLYIGGDSGDVWVLNLGTLVATTFTLAGASGVYNMAMDGTYLFAATDIGLWRYNLSTTATNLYDPTGGANTGANLPDYFVYPVTIIGTVVYAGTGAGLWKYDYSDDSSEVYNSTSGSQTGPNLPTDTVGIFSYDPDTNQLWVDATGIWVLNTNTNTSKIVDLTDYGFAAGSFSGFILRDSDSNLWMPVGSELGIVEETTVIPKVTYDKTGIHYDPAVNYDLLAANAFISADYARTRLFTFGNGLLLTSGSVNQADSVRIGGTLTSSITLSTSTFGFSINQGFSGGQGFFNVSNSSASIGQGGVVSGLTRIQFTSTGMLMSVNNDALTLKISDTRSTTLGLEYSADYSAGYSTRSLVDKGYVDGAISAATVTASNGLTKTGANITLGGALTTNTNITGAFILAHNITTWEQKALGTNNLVSTFVVRKSDNNGIFAIRENGDGYYNGKFNINEVSAIYSFSVKPDSTTPFSGVTSFIDGSTVTNGSRAMLILGSTTYDEGALGTFAIDGNTNRPTIAALAQGPNSFAIHAAMGHQTANGILITSSHNAIPGSAMPNGHLMIASWKNATATAFTATLTKSLVVIDKTVNTLSGFDHTGTLLELRNIGGATGDYLRAWDASTTYFQVKSDGEQNINSKVINYNIPFDGLITTYTLASLHYSSVALMKYTGSSDYSTGSAIDINRTYTNTGGQPLLYTIKIISNADNDVGINAGANNLPVHIIASSVDIPTHAGHFEAALTKTNPTSSPIAVYGKATVVGTGEGFAFYGDGGTLFNSGIAKIMTINNDNALTRVLVHDNATGEIKYRDVATISAGIGAPSSADKDLTPAAVTVDNGSTTLTITNTPTGLLIIALNGVIQTLGDGVKTKNFYFSGDGGTTARAYNAIVATDVLYFNAVIAGFSLATTDVIDMIYI